MRGPDDAPKLPPGIGHGWFDLGRVWSSAHDPTGRGDEGCRALLVVYSASPQMPFPVLFADEFAALRTDGQLEL